MSRAALRRPEATVALLLDDGWRILDARGACEELLDSSAANLLGRSIEPRGSRASGAEVLGPDDGRLQALLEERDRQGYARGELTIRRKDGTTVPVEAFFAVFLDARGQTRSSVTLRDLTEQRRAEDRLRLIADSGAVLGASLDVEATLGDLTRLAVPRMADCCIVDLREGDGLRRVAAAHRDPRLSGALLALGSPGPLQERAVGIYRVARTGEAELVPVVEDAWLRAAMREDSYRKVVASGAPPRSMVIVPLVRRAEVLGVLTLCSLSDARCYDEFDLTTAQAIADRAALAIENARLYEQTVRAKRLREDVLGIVSHDLRGPLGAIGLNAHLLATRTGAREAVAIERAVPRAEALINDLLTAAALEAGSLPLHKNEEDLCAVVQEAVEMHAPRAKERSVVLETTFAEGMPPVPMDRHRVLEALGNLIENALKFTPPGGRVRVDARRCDGGVSVAVSDTGPGIAADQLPRLFDRFWQGATRRSAGAGLGLSIANGIVEAHGGSLDVDSAPGRGATFRFSLPLPGA